jgi:RNA polymerase sigma-70 factor (ECF subfamily)
MSHLFSAWLSQRVVTVDAATPRDEERWIARLQNRESGAWDEFVRQFHDLVHAVIRQTAARRRMKLQQSDVDDLAADVFAAALGSLERFRHDCRLSTWLSTITRRIVDRELGKAWRVKVARTDVAHDECPDRTNLQPLENLLLHENQERVEAALEKLPAACREILRMHYVQRLSYREISARLQISINSVGPALARGRERLRKILRKDADSGELRMLGSDES